MLYFSFNKKYHMSNVKYDCFKWHATYFMVYIYTDMLNTFLSNLYFPDWLVIFFNICFLWSHLSNDQNLITTSNIFADNDNSYGEVMRKVDHSWWCHILKTHPFDHWKKKDIKVHQLCQKNLMKKIPPSNIMHSNIFPFV